jgi:flagellar protein FliT
MMTNEEILSIYEDMSMLMDQMLAAANQSDWDQLIVLEKQCAAHVVTLKQHDQVPAALGEAGRLRKVDLIKKLLNDDRQIRDLITPWMAHLSALMGNTRVQAQAFKAYRSV